MVVGAATLHEQIASQYAAGDDLPCADAKLLIPIKRSLKGLITHWLWERPLKRSTFPDFANFWDLLHRRKLIGTITDPVASSSRDTVGDAVVAVRALIDQGRD